MCGRTEIGSHNTPLGFENKLYHDCYHESVKALRQWTYYVSVSHRSLKLR